MKTKDTTNFSINSTASIIEAMKRIDINSKGILVVVDDEERVLGTVTDGDIRRAILAENSIKSSIASLYNKNFIFTGNNESILTVKRLFLENKIRIIPILDENRRLVSYYEMDDLIDFNKIEKENPVLIMAGGIGTRLKPLTDNIPKPMLKIGDKPILQIIIEQFRDFGFGNVLLSINYRGEIIENYFRDGKDFGVSIRYIKETKRLGTAGAIKLAQDHLNKPFFVINGDILTNVNYYDLLQFHNKNKYSMTIGTRIYEMQVPFGVVGVGEGFVTSLLEKPVYSYIVNGGVYVLNPSIIHNIPENEYYDMTELINNLFDNKEKIGNYPINDYWMDIGKIEDYYKANDDICSLE